MKQHTVTLKVRSYELDFFGHVNNAVYLNYLEIGRVELMRSLGVTFEDFYRQKQLPVVVNITINFQRPCLLDDEIQLSTAIIKVGNSSFTLHSEGRNLTDGNQVAFDADVTLAMMDTEKGQSSALPDEFRHLLNEATWVKN